MCLSRIYDFWTDVYWLGEGAYTRPDMRPLWLRGALLVAATLLTPVWIVLGMPRWRWVRRIRRDHHG